MIEVRKLLEKERSRLGVAWSVLEKDYILSWVLWGLSEVETLNKTLVFKGETALKKVYFEDYRFSEDLDFTALEGSPSGFSLETSIALACTKAQKAMEELMPDPVLEYERYTERTPHPEGQEAFAIRAKLPWHRSLHVNVMVEITRSEKMVTQPEWRQLSHPYFEDLDFQIQCYSIEEIVAEKLRAILQNTKKLHERGWARSRARDYYDIWCILSAYQGHFEDIRLAQILDEKCVGKGVNYNSSTAFFEENFLQNARRDWKRWLEPLVRELPEFDLVIRELKHGLEKMIPCKGNSISKVN